MMLELGRALWHFGFLMLVVVLGHLVPFTYSKPIAGVILSLVIMFELFRVKTLWFNTFCQRYFSWGFRKDEKWRRSAMLDCAVALGIVFFFLPFKIFVVSTLICAIADPAARIFGKTWGKTKIPYTNEKTFVGSSAFFISTFCVVVFYYSTPVAFITAILTTLMEAYANRNYFFDDNFTVPIGSAVCLFLFL